jgi:hypothetical protein
VEFGGRNWELNKTNTWELVPRPSGSNIVTGIWVYRHKLRSNGSLERYKACWVLRGFTQRSGIDFDETSVLWLSLLVSV